LKFKDFESFGLFLNKIKTNDQPDLEKIKRITKTLNIRSHKEFYNSLAEAEHSRSTGYARQDSQDEVSQYLSPDEDSIRLSPIIDPQLAAILNEKQEIQFGEGSVFRVQNDYTFKFTVGDDGLIEEYYKALQSGVAKKPTGEIGVIFGGLNVYKTQVKVISLDNSEGRTKNARADAMCGLYYADDLRMEGKLYSTWSVFYSSGGIETKVIKRIRTCNWLRCKTTWDNPQPANRLAMNFDIYVSLQGAIATRITKQLVSNPGSNLLFHSFGSLGGVFVSRFDFSGWSCHSGTYGTSTLTCSNQFYDLTYLAYTPLVCP
jgi:hypothetical protein